MLPALLERAVATDPAGTLRAAGFRYVLLPDVLTFAKGVANGLPLGGVVARAEVMHAVHANSISTFGGNPVSVASANATLDVLLDRDLQRNAREVGARLRAGLAAAAARHPWIAEVVHWRTHARAGEGAVREVCDVLLAAQGHVAEILAGGHGSRDGRRA